MADEYSYELLNDKNAFSADTLNNSLQSLERNEPALVKELHETIKKGMLASTF